MKQQPAQETNSTIALLNSELQKAIREGNIALASQYTQMIAQLTNPAPQQQPVQDTNEVEVPEDHSELDFSGDEEVDETIDSDEIEM